MQIMGRGKNNRLIIELNLNDLRLIVGEDRDFSIGEKVQIGNTLSILHQLSRKKDRYIGILTELSNVLNSF